MDVYQALYTTRAMRRVRPDPISLEVQRRILDAAIRAPSGGNQQGWRFLLVDDPELRRRLGRLYRACMDQLWSTIYRERVESAKARPDAPESREFERMYRSAEWLADHFAEVPLLLFSFAQHDPSGGSIFPATWSAMLAARAEGVGSALTSVMALRAPALLEILGVPPDQGWIPAACVTFGYPVGRWGVAPRRPVHEVASRNLWDGPLGFEVPRPLWPAKGSSGA
jgi:nitroreductase